MSDEIFINEIPIVNDITVNTTAAVNSVNNRFGNVLLSASDVGLGNVDNTSDLNKPISYATLSSLNFIQSEINSINSIIEPLSSNWDSTYNTVQSNSALNWNYQGTDIKALTGNWDGGNIAYTNLTSNSAAYLSAVDLSFLSVSGNWNDSYTNLTSNSAAYLSAVDLSFLSVSGNWNDSYTNLTSNSAAYLSAVDLSFLSVSGNWNDSYTNLIQNSSAYLSAVDLSFLSVSGNWNDSYTNLIQNSSAYLSAVDLSFLSVSGNWNDSYTNLIQNSSAYLSAVDLSFLSVSGNWNDSYTNLTKLSTIYDAVTSVNGTIYQIQSVNNNGSVILSLPNSFRTPGDLNVGGNLYVAGSGFQLTTSTLTVSSPIIYINNSLSGAGNVYDIGFVGHFKSNIYQHTGLVRSAQNNYWSLFSGLTSEPLNAPTLNYSDPTFTIDTLRANILGSLSGNVTGNVTGNADTVTKGVYTNQTYSDPSWITSLADTKITGTNFATNTTLQSTSALLTPLTTTNTLTGSLYSTLQSTSALLTPLTTTNTLTSQLVLNTAINSLTGNWNTAYASTTALNLSSSKWSSVYSLINSATAGTFNLNNVSLVGNLSSTYVYGASNETVLTDGSNMYGNGTNTITLNYLSGVYASSQIYAPTISAVKFYGDGSNLTGVSTYTGSDLKSLSGNWQSTYNTVSSLSGNWQSAYQSVSTTNALNLSSVYWNTAYNNAIYSINGTANQIVATPTGNNNGNNSYNLSLPNSVNITTLNVSSLSATSNINVNGNLALNNFNSKLYFAGNYLQGNGNAIIVGAYGMGFRAQGGLANSFLLATDGVIGFGNDVSYWYTNNQRVGLTYDGPATFAQKDFNNSQTYRLYNTYTDVNNYERGAITFSKPTSAFTLSVESAGTGVNRDFWINTAGTPKLVVTSGGNVGIGTINPNQTLSVFGNISSSGLIYDQIGNSNQWNTAYSLVSGGIVASFSLPQSASWISTTSTVSSLSGGWQTAYQSVSTTNALSLSSSYWNTAYSIVSGGIVSTLNLPQSASWISTTSTVSSLSGGWQSVYSYVNSTSATNNPTYNTSTFAKLSAQVYQAGTGVFSIKPIIGTNTASGYSSNVAGGINNTASGCFSNVAGGLFNNASGYYSNVAGGRNNTASGCFSNVAGGINNTASGYFSNVAGGRGNTASGCYSSILGGINNNTNNQACSFIVGQGIIASQPNFTYVNKISSQGLVYDATGNSNQWNTAYSIVSGGIVSTLNLPQSAVWQSTTATVSSLSGGWQTAYTWTQNNSAIATFSTSVSTNYVYCTSLSSTYVYGNSSETTLTDGTNLTGNGAGTLTLNYSSGVYIGSNTIPTIDNSYNFGNGTNRWKAIYAANGTIQTSDARQKTNIIPSPLGLEFITTLNPVSYNFIIGSNEIEKDQDGNITAVIPVSGKRTHFGLLAQEVQQVIPQGIDFGGWILTDLNDPNSYQGLRYEEFIAPMIKSIQELSSIVNDLKIENQQLWTIVNSLTSK